ncbi:MAG: hypothetical protein QXL94_01390 [Candidatus Parvarchaeum sp.]
MKFDHNTKKILKKDLLENTKDLMKTLSLEDEFDAIILGTLLTLHSNENIFPLFGDTPELKNVLKFGINEIARLVKKHMAYKTALNHTQKLIKEGYLIDINQLIMEKLEEIEPIIMKEDKIPDKIASTFVEAELEKLYEKYHKTKRMLIVNLDKILRTSTS